MKRVWNVTGAHFGVKLRQQGSGPVPFHPKRLYFFDQHLDQHYLLIQINVVPVNVVPKCWPKWWSKMLCKRKSCCARSKCWAKMLIQNVGCWSKMLIKMLIQNVVPKSKCCSKSCWSKSEKTANLIKLVKPYKLCTELLTLHPTVIYANLRNIVMLKWSCLLNAVLWYPYTRYRSTKSVAAKICTAVRLPVRHLTLKHLRVRARAP